MGAEKQLDQLLEQLEIKSYTQTLPMEEYRSLYQDIPLFLGYCKECNNYGRQWVCPPFDFDPDEYLLPYSTVCLHGYQVELPEELTSRKYTPEEKYTLAYEVARVVRERIDPLLLAEEKKHPGSEAFLPGKCHLCPDGACTRLASPRRPCKYPERARHSLEQFGFDLYRSAAELLGVPMLWGSEDTIPPYYFYIGALLTP